MKVYKVTIGADYPYLSSGDGELIRRFPNLNSMGSIKAVWEPMAFHEESVPTRIGDFWGVLGYMMLVNKSISDQLLNCINKDVELLPAHIEDRSGEFLLWHFINVIDVLDVANTTFKSWGPMPVKWAFQRERFTRPMLFRIPNPSPMLFVATGIEPAERDFYIQYHKIRATGLDFKLLWEG